MHTKNLSDPIQYLSGVGPKRAESFSEIGLTQIEHLLFYFPVKYLDRSRIIEVDKLLQFVINGYEGEITIVAQVDSTELIRYRNKQIFKVQFSDAKGRFECVWFKGINYFKSAFHKGDYYAISGKPTLSRYGNLQFVHPDFDKFTENESNEYISTGKIIPFYTIPKELKSRHIGDIGLRRIIKKAVDEYSNLLKETLPQSVIKNNNLPDIVSSVQNIHFPKNDETLEKARERFKYEELFYLEILVALRKFNYLSKSSGIQFSIDADLIKKFLNSLPFELTSDQLKVLSDIKKDMTSTKPMNRLLQGDVGSGKTVVSVIGILIAISTGYQTVIMAPTEILADQHFNTISEFLKDFNFNISLLIGGTKSKEKSKIKEGIRSGECQIIVGTHAIIEEDVEFNKLGLVIIDEQHRFGVTHRGKLISKGITPDVLIMTATPIPRTLTMTLYGDLDLSIIKEMPKNRMRVKTVLRGENSLNDIYEFVIDKNKEDYQTFIVFPLVEESEKMELKAAEVYYEKLKNGAFRDKKIGLLHGRMNWREKEETMLDFKDKKYDILVSTTVIEVGIDIPEANIIIINDAERFGLSQLHQLRGRVGRGIKQAYCILVTKDELAAKTKNFNFNFDFLSKTQIDFHKSKIRLNAMVKYSSGFDLSEVDLKLRGPGDIFGKMQSGFPQLLFANLTTDQDILIAAKHDAFSIIEKDKKLERNENFMVKRKLHEYYSENLSYSLIG